jgi:Zn-dependent metalloprotease
MQKNCGCQKGNQSMERNAFCQGEVRDKTAETPDRSNQKGCGKALYAQLDSDRVRLLASAAGQRVQEQPVQERRAQEQPVQERRAQEQLVPSGFGIIPPYMLEQLDRANGGKGGFAATLEKTINLQNRPSPQQSWSSDDFNGSREVYDARGKETLPGDKARFEGESPVGNQEVDRAYDYTGIVRDFYLKEYKRNSIDGAGMKFISSINFGQNYENAFWDGSQMAYGRPGANSPFKTFMLLDVAAHEITHGVTQKESMLRYFGQPGALNESLSDVFGELIQQYSKNQTADQADWLVGDGIFKDGIKGRALRDMLHPGTAYDDPKLGKDPQPDHMKNYDNTYNDNFGVHINSGIPNRAFALFATAVGGHAWDDPGHIWFEARKQAGDHPSFAVFAYHTIEAARRIGHQPDEVEKLRKAWNDVGVTPTAPTMLPLPSELLPADAMGKLIQEKAS